MALCRHIQFLHTQSSIQGAGTVVWLRGSNFIQKAQQSDMRSDNQPLPTDSELLAQLDGLTEAETSANFLRLEQEFGFEALAPAYERIFCRITRYAGRMNILFRLVPYARERSSISALAVRALQDKSRQVRHHACAALAYALDTDKINKLSPLQEHPDRRTREYAEAAIDAIESGNHHYFADRNHSGKVFWHPGGAPTKDF